MEATASFHISEKGGLCPPFLLWNWSWISKINSYHLLKKRNLSHGFLLLRVESGIIFFSIFQQNDTYV